MAYARDRWLPVALRPRDRRPLTRVRPRTGHEEQEYPTARLQAK